MQRFKFMTPTTISVYAPPYSGKSTLTRKILMHANELFTKPPTKIIYCYKVWLSMLDEMKKEMSNLETHQGLPSVDQLDEWTTGKSIILILDDLQQQVQRDRQSAELFSVDSHHRNITVIYLCHNIYGRGPFAKLISVATHYMILFRNNRDVEQVHRLARQVYGPGKGATYFLDAYKKATTPKWGYLVVNIHPDRDEDGYKLLTKILPGEDTIVYKPKEV